jgi:hypothetical protein
VELLLKVCHLERRRVHVGHVQRRGHHVEGRHAHRGQHGGLRRVDGKVDGRGLQLRAVGGIKIAHAEGALREGILREAVRVDVHPVGEHRVHGLHGGGEAESHGLEGSDGAGGSWDGVVRPRGGHGRLHTAVLLLVLVLLVRVLLLQAAIVVVHVVVRARVLVETLRVVVVRLRHAGGRYGDRPGLGEVVCLAVGIVGGIENALPRVEGAVEVKVLVLHVCTE